MRLKRVRQTVSEPPLGAPEEHRHRRRDLVLLLILLLLLFGIAGGGSYYWMEKRLPLVQIPEITERLGLAPHFVFSITGVEQPVAVALSPRSDRIFVAEGGGERLIHIFDREGNHLGAFAPPDSTPGDRSPGFIAASTDGKLYVTDSYRHDITIYTLDGEYVATFVPNGDPGFEWFPVGVAADGEGSLYVTDQTHRHHRVMVFDGQGMLVERFGITGKGPGMFAFPTGILVGKDGNIYVADSANSRVQVFDSSGELLYMIYQTDMSLPRALAQDRSGRLHILDSLAQDVSVVRPGAALKLEFRYGSLGKGNGQFYYPSDLALDGSGRIYIADRFNNRVQVWSF